MKTRAWIKNGDPSECFEWGQDFKVRAVIIYPVWLPAGKGQTYLRASQYHMAQNRQWHMLLLVFLELEDCWRRDESLWRISGSAWKSVVMGNAYISCHYTDDIQKSHRKTDCINLHDQEITFFNICLLIVPCRRDGLRDAKCLALGDRKFWAAECPQRLVENSLSSAQRGFHLQSCHRPQTPQQIQATEITLGPKTDNSLNYLLMWQAERMSTSCCHRQSFVNLQSVGYSSFTVMLQDRDEIN